MSNSSAVALGELDTRTEKVFIVRIYTGEIPGFVEVEIPGPNGENCLP